MKKNLEIQDYFEIALRRKWFFIIPFFVILMLAVGYILWAPKIYRASTLILVQQPELSPTYVQPTIIERRGEGLQTIEQQIKSRTFLDMIVEEFDLHAKAESKKTPSRTWMLQSLRNRITIQVTGNQIFSISYEDQNPEMAMEITNRLATLFIERSLQQREERALGTISFLDKELERVKNLLKQQEKKIWEFKKTHLGVLPEQLDDRSPVPADIMESDDLAVLYSLLRRLRLKYTEEHPEIISLKVRIAEIESRKGITMGTVKEDTDKITTQRSEEDQREIGISPYVEHQWTKLTRSYEVTQREYQSLLDKKLQAELAANMERKQKEQRFQVLDEATIPQGPVKPNRSQVLLMGLLLAVAGGGGLVFAMEYLDTSFYKLEDLESFAELPVIASISEITEKKTFPTMMKEFTKLPVIASISNKTKTFFTTWEKFSEKILLMIENISKTIKK